MGWLLRKCKECGNYTLKNDACPHCGGGLKVPHPPRFSPDDKYLKYRMALKMEAQTGERDNNQGT